MGHLRTSRPHRAALCHRLPAHAAWHCHDLYPHRGEQCDHRACDSGWQNRGRHHFSRRSTTAVICDLIHACDRVELWHAAGTIAFQPQLVIQAASSPPCSYTSYAYAHTVSHTKGGSKLTATLASSHTVLPVAPASSALPSSTSYKAVGKLQSQASDAHEMHMELVVCASHHSCPVS